MPFQEAFFTSIEQEQGYQGLTWVEQAPFDLVISCPWIGKNKYQHPPQLDLPLFMHNHLFYLYYGALLVKPGGLLLAVTSSDFLRSALDSDSPYGEAKEKLLNLLSFVHAYRLPNYLSEQTNASCDILVFRKI